MLRQTDNAPLRMPEPRRQAERRYRNFRAALVVLACVPLLATFTALLFASFLVGVAVGLASAGLVVALGKNLESIMVFLFDSKRYGLSCTCGEYIDEMLPWQCGYCRYDLDRGHNAPMPGPPFLGSFLDKCWDCKVKPVSILCPKCTRKILLREAAPGEPDLPARSLPELERDEVKAREKQERTAAAEHAEEISELERMRERAAKLDQVDDAVGKLQAKWEKKQPTRKKPIEQIIEEEYREENERQMGYASLRLRVKRHLERVHENDAEAVVEGLAKFDNWQLRHEERLL